MDLGRTNLVQHNIVLSDPAPFKERYRRIPPQLYDEVREHLQEMLRLGAIRRSCSPWASAIVLVRKKNGKLRFCIDLRKLNQRTQKDAYSLPRIEQVLEHLDGSCIFSTLDLTSGYWQVEMVEACKPYTAFTVGPLGFYECETMPFGATNAPATFQRLMEDCLGDLNLNWCIVYLDDVIVFADSPEEHLKRLAAVFTKLRAAGLKLKPSKCTFFQKEIGYLGHVISEKGVSTDPVKIEAVVNWPVPTTVCDVRSFLGFVGYYRRFIKGFSSIARPLHDLTKGLESQSKKVSKRTKVAWGEKEQDAFDKLKQACVSSPILAYPDYKQPFILHTDSSTYGLGAVLYQKQQGHKRVIAYASRSLSKSEVNYAPHKLEFLALKWAVTEKFKEYLYGGNVFEAYTDNNPLTYILSTAKLDACGQRWVAELANFKFNLHYKPGPTNVDADALSRIKWPEVLTELEEREFDTLQSDGVQAACIGALVSSGFIDTLCSSTQVIPLQSYVPTQAGMSKGDWIQLQSTDPDLKVLIEGLQNKTLRKRHIQLEDSKSLKHYLRIKKQLKLRDGVLYRRTLSDNSKSRMLNYQLVLPKGMIDTAMKGCHDEVGHQGRDRTVSLVRERFYWDTLYKDVSEYVAKCSRCVKRKSTPDKAPMQPIHMSQPLELVHMDFLSLEPSKGNIENILIITDHYTRYAQAYPCSNQTAATTAKLLWENFIRHYGWPQKFISDQGRQFESELIEDLCKVARVEKVRTSPYHPQTNGMCERFNSTLLNMLGTLSPEEKKDWKSHALTMCHAYNSTVHSSTNFSLYFLMFGRHPRIAIDFQMGLSREGVGHISKSRYIQKLHQRLKYAFQKADIIARREAERQKKLYDRKCKGVQLQPHDLVLVKKVAFTGKHKIQDRWEEGEYEVLAQPDPAIPVYKVKPVDGGKERTLHRNLLLALGIQVLPECDDSSSESESEDDPIMQEKPDTGKLCNEAPNELIHMEKLLDTSDAEASSPPSIQGDDSCRDISASDLTPHENSLNEARVEDTGDVSSDISDLPPDAGFPSTDEGKEEDSLEANIASRAEESLIKTQELLDFIDGNITD